MKKIIIIGFILNIFILLAVIPIIIFSFYLNNLFLKSLLIIISIICLILGIKSFPHIYLYLLTEFHNIKWLCKKPNKEELQIIEDAKKLIRKVNNNITISDFNVYKVNFLNKCWFNYDSITNEFNIFIPFNVFLKLSKDICFEAILHEILHSQSFKNNCIIFNSEFSEGLNQLLTLWLIENYSEKYKITRKFKNTNQKFTVYEKEVNIVKKIIVENKINLEELFINYINFNPNYFKNFVPSKYLIK